MTIIDRYIGLNIARSTGAAILVLLLFFTFVDFIDALGDVGKGGYTLGLAAAYTLLGMPRLLYQLFPSATLIGVMVGLGLMANHGELTVIRASGASLMRVVRAVFSVGAGLILASIVIGELIAPPLVTWADGIRDDALTGSATHQSRHGFWARDGQSYINIRGVLPDGSARYVTIYEFDNDHQLRVITRAKSAQHDGQRWNLQGIRQTVIGPAGAKARTLDKAVWDSLLDPGLVTLAALEPETLAVPELMRYINWLDDNDQDTSRYRYALWSKLGYPLATAVMILLAIPFAFGSLREISMGQRIVIGVFIGTFFHLINQTTGHLSQVYGIGPAVSAIGPSLILMIFAVILLRKVR